MTSARRHSPPLETSAVASVVVQFMVAQALVARQSTVVIDMGMSTIQRTLLEYVRALGRQALINAPWQNVAVGARK